MHAKFAIYISVKDVKDQIFLVFGKDQLFLVRPKIMGRTKKRNSFEGSGSYMSPFCFGLGFRSYCPVGRPSAALSQASRDREVPVPAALEKVAKKNTSRWRSLS